MPQRYHFASKLEMPPRISPAHFLLVVLLLAFAGSRPAAAQVEGKIVQAKPGQNQSGPAANPRNADHDQDDPEAEEESDDAPAADQNNERYPGNFSLAFETPNTEALLPYQKEFRESQLFDQTIDELNETIALPVDLKIRFTECGAVNAFYDSNEHQMLMCYELIQFFHQQFSALYDDDEAAAENAVVDATIFVFHHELGHALVDLLKVPITGKEEDAVDDLATLVLLHDWEGGDESALNAAQAFYMIGEAEEAAAEEPDESAIEKLPYYDEHSLGKQRFYQIACIVYGSDPQAHADLVGDTLPATRAERCPSEFQQKSNSWSTLLADFYAAADQENASEGPEE